MVIQKIKAQFWELDLGVIQGASKTCLIGICASNLIWKIKAQFQELQNR